jgi:apolipoprotein D and lipocalin family protein
VKTVALILAGVILTGLVIGCASTGRSADAPQTVSFVDLQRYAGLWYQVARYPHSFQRRECAVSTARYTLLDDGRVEVRNDCWADEAGGASRQSVRAFARPIDESNSWLKVRFFRLFNADYLIIELDPDYRWAVVTGPDRNTLWILAREPALPEETYESVVSLLVSRGFDRGKIIRTSGQ